MSRITSVIGGFLGLACLVSGALPPTRYDRCKCLPGDACWPSEQDWNRFNVTVGGRLIKTIPLGSPCHDPHYDSDKCEELKSQWTKAPVHIDSSSSVQAAIFANASCDPFTPRSTPCLLGNYVSYAVNVTGPTDIAATIRFADKNNVRLVVRNTGHDYMGRSTGAGGLAIWTHFLKNITVKDWSDGTYRGKALKLSAGVQGSDVLSAADAVGLIAVTGECPTVGIAGGYTMGGGHSPLSTAFGLSADNTLEFEVVTADGKLVYAHPSSPEHADLFWALSGSGSGNYGVVVSVTVKAHPNAITSGASFVIDDSGIDYGSVLDVWHAKLPAIVDSGCQVTYAVSNTSLQLFSITGYNRTQDDIFQTLQPFIETMAAMNTSLEPKYTTFSRYHDHYLDYFGPLPAGLFGGASDQLMGGRLLPRKDLSSIGPAIKKTLQLGVRFIGQAESVSRFATSQRAVLPQWRDALVMSAYSLPFSLEVPIADMEARQDYITNTIMPLIESVTPNAGAYINEADYQQPDWQNAFYGSNYGRLLSAKKKYDPKGLFYNRIAVGSEKWVSRDDGRLCLA
ncbi:FAD binding domain protein [Aureobasidium pullulans]|uniref:FAD binding domain protein n=1 Tax=Aureobasidium pullulans TaxID=5580 RepID=A0A4S9BH33_AURPU|nr:FAD binding domain protein [Aureobasidium pullulans]